MPVNSFGCIIPSNAEFRQLERELIPRYANGRLAFDIMPFQNVESSQIVFNQPEVLKGLQQWRGIDQPTSSVRDRYNPYGRYCILEPGYWGEHDRITEEQLIRWAQPGSCNARYDATQQVAELQARLIERRYNRVELSIWQALVFGRYEALNNQGQVVHQATFNTQQVSSGIPWTDFVNSRPLNDFRLIQLLGRGTSADFGSCATGYMNRVTANLLYQNQNPLDVGKIGLSACCTFMGPEVVSQQFAAQGLPKLMVYDQGYIDDGGNFQPYIPDGYVVIIGCRPNMQTIGHYFLTLNGTTCGTSTGFWQKYVDTCDREVPRSITIYDGHNGGPGIEYPRAVVVLRVGG